MLIQHNKEAGMCPLVPCEPQDTTDKIAELLDEGRLPQRVGAETSMNPPSVSA